MASRVRSSALIVIVAAAIAAAARLAAQAPPPASQAATKAADQCRLSWIGHEAEIEEFLKTATIEKRDTVPVGVTKPWRVTFAPGGPVARAAWKPLSPSYRRGFFESYKSELAAYALDGLLDMHQVPPVVERKFDGEVGALIYWVDNVNAWVAKDPPRGVGVRWVQQVSRMRLFDQFIANIDRNAGNLLYDDDWHLFLIDHSRAFTERKSLKDTVPATKVERAFWQKIEALTPAQLKTTLGAYLDDRQIEAMFARRDKMREEITKLARKRGDANVFF